MSDLLWLIPALPLIGFIVLALFGSRMSQNGVAFVGAGSVGLSALILLVIGAGFLSGNEASALSQTLWTWMDFPGFNASLTLRIDSLSLIFVFVITFVGFLIHLYSVAYMRDEEGYSRFFAYMNLFVASMLVLVMADNLLFLYLGWEGVGLCSYLLIGFWFKDPGNNYAARKAFIITRIGDTALIIGLFLLFTSFNTLNIQEILTQAPDKWSQSSTVAIAATLLLLGGAVGKSAQLPLQTWLPDAMAGPTPVSALIHAATMVTAGVYLIARTHVLFDLAPEVKLLVASIGAVTLLLAGFSAIAQSDIKRVLAYSTISQIGYMFLALGVGAWTAAVFHFMIHAFFKALLFLGAGVVISSMHHEQNMFKMGGLRKAMPLTYWTYLIGAASLSALPLVTAGFYSKDLILWQVWASAKGNALLWLAGLTGAFITAIYIFRSVFITFFGRMKVVPVNHSHLAISIPLIVLAVLSLVGGFIEIPGLHVTLFSGILGSTIADPLIEGSSRGGSEFLFQVISGTVALAGIWLAYLFYLKKPQEESLQQPGALYRLWNSGWGFDAIYNNLFVRPMVYISKINRNDFVDKFYAGIASLTAFLHRSLSLTQTGNVRWYMAGLAIGAIVSITIILVL
jgi:NADH-quinone oxidoreductase subunit L